MRTDPLFTNRPCNSYPSRYIMLSKIRFLLNNLDPDTRIRIKMFKTGYVDPDPVKIGPDPQHCWRENILGENLPTKNRWAVATWSNKNTSIYSRIVNRNMFVEPRPADLYLLQQWILCGNTDAVLLGILRNLPLFLQWSVYISIQWRRHSEILRIVTVIPFIISWFWKKVPLFCVSLCWRYFAPFKLLHTFWFSAKQWKLLNGKKPTNHERILRGNSVSSSLVLNFTWFLYFIIL